MALQDPTDPTGFDPAIADAFAAQSDPYGFAWPPPEWSTDEQQIGGTMGVVENAAAPALAAPEVAPTPGGGSAALIENAAAPSFEDLSPVSAELGAPSYQLPDQFPEGLKLIHEGETYAEPITPPLPFTPDPNLRGIQSEEPVEQAGVELGQDPVKLAIAEQDFARRQREWADEQAQVERNRDQMRADENYARQREVQIKTQTDMDKLNAEAVALANTKIDDKRWFKNASTGQKIGAWVAAIVGGLVSGRTGGPNTGLQNVLKMIDDDVEAQKFDLQNQQQAIGARRSVIADNYARSGDMFRAAESYRMASYDRTIANLQSQAQQFDPRSARAIEIGKLIQGVAAQRQASQAAALDRYYKLNTADAELQGKLLANATAAKKLAGIGAGTGTPKLTPEQWKAQGFSNAPPVPMNAKEFRDWQEGQKRDADVSQARQAPADKVRENGVPGLVQKDGQPFLARDKAVAADLTNKLDKSKQIISIIDRIDAIRDRVGGESSWGNSDEYNQLKVLEKEALLLKKGGTQGMSSDADMENITASLGASDVTSFRSKAAGLREARRRTEQAIKSELRSNGFDNLELLKFDPPKPHENTDGETKIKQRAYHDDVIEQSGSPRPKRDINTGEIQFE